MASALDLEVVNGTLVRLEKEVDDRLKRIRNLKQIKTRIIQQLNKEGK